MKANLPRLLNSVGNSTAHVSLGTESKDLYWTQSPGVNGVGGLQCSNNKAMFI